MKFSFLGKMYIVISCLSPALIAYGQEYGMVMDVVGDAELQRPDKPPVKPLAGDTLMDGDRLKLNKDSELFIVSFDDCVEYHLTGNIEITIAWILEKQGNGSVTEIRQLPACYRPEDINPADSGSVLGGVILRSHTDDSMDPLRQEAGQGQLSNSALITLLIYELNYGKTDTTMDYFNLLKQREPESSLVKIIEKRMSELE